MTNLRTLTPDPDARRPLNAHEVAVQLGCPSKRVVELYVRGYLDGWMTGKTMRTLRFTQDAVDDFRRRGGVAGIDAEEDDDVEDQGAA